MLMSTAAQSAPLVPAAIRSAQPTTISAFLAEQIGQAEPEAALAETAALVGTSAEQPVHPEVA